MSNGVREMIWIGVDVGVSGAVAAIGRDGIIGVRRNKEPLRLIANWLSEITSGVYATAIVEKVSSSPQMGVVSSFTFGKSAGQIEGMLAALGIPFDFATPQKWQKAMGCLSGGDKNKTKAKALQLFPTWKVVHAESDALLIAEFNRRSRGMQ